MNNLKISLRKKLNNASKIVVLGIGSRLMQDDAIGVLIADKLSGILKHKKTICPVEIISAESSPEAFTGEIKRENPSHLIIIDAANFNAAPGTCRIIDIKDISGVSFSTHRLPTKIFIEYIKKSVNCEVIVLGIQPKSLQFDLTITTEAIKCVENVSTLLSENFYNK